ncbi:ESCRT-0 subunit protein hse1, partial [Lunasporangiospora selenospora]
MNPLYGDRNYRGSHLGEQAQLHADGASTQPAIYTPPSASPVVFQPEVFYATQQQQSITEILDEMGGAPSPTEVSPPVAGSMTSLDSFKATGAEAPKPPPKDEVPMQMTDDDMPVTYNPPLSAMPATIVQSAMAPAAPFENFTPAPGPISASAVDQASPTPYVPLTDPTMPQPLMMPVKPYQFYQPKPYQPKSKPSLKGPLSAQRQSQLNMRAQLQGSLEEETSSSTPVQQPQPQPPQPQFQAHHQEQFGAQAQQHQLPQQPMVAQVQAPGSFSTQPHHLPQTLDMGPNPSHQPHHLPQTPGMGPAQSQQQVTLQSVVPQQAQLVHPQHQALPHLPIHTGPEHINTLNQQGPASATSTSSMTPSTESPSKASGKSFLNAVRTSLFSKDAKKDAKDAKHQQHQHSPLAYQQSPPLQPTQGGMMPPSFGLQSGQQTGQQTGQQQYGGPIPIASSGPGAGILPQQYVPVGMVQYGQVQYAQGPPTSPAPFGQHGQVPVSLGSSGPRPESVIAPGPSQTPPHSQSHPQSPPHSQSSSQSQTQGQFQPHDHQLPNQQELQQRIPEQDRPEQSLTGGHQQHASGSSTGSSPDQTRATSPYPAIMEKSSKRTSNLPGGSGYQNAASAASAASAAIHAARMSVAMSSSSIPHASPSVGPVPGPYQSAVEPQEQPVVQIPQQMLSGGPNSPGGSDVGSRLSVQSTLSEQRQMDVITRAQAKFDFAGEDEGDLSFKKGDIINVIELVNNDWWKGSLRRDIGIFPALYVQEIKANPGTKYPSITVSVRHSFMAPSPTENGPLPLLQQQQQPPQQQQQQRSSFQGVSSAVSAALAAEDNSSSSSVGGSGSLGGSAPASSGLSNPSGQETGYRNDSGLNNGVVGGYESDHRRDGSGPGNNAEPLLPPSLSGSNNVASTGSAMGPGGQQSLFPAPPPQPMVSQSASSVYTFFPGSGQPPISPPPSMRNAPGMGGAGPGPHSEGMMRFQQPGQQQQQQQPLMSPTSPISPQQQQQQLQGARYSLPGTVGANPTSPTSAGPPGQYGG